MHRNDSPHQLQYFLRERTKELTALHKTARLMQDDSRPIAELLAEVVNLLPPAWQYPEVTVGRIAVNGLEVTTRNFNRGKWMMTAPIQFAGGVTGLIEVGYLEERPPSVEGPFLAEERELLDSLADMLRNYLQYRMAIDEIKRANDNLERLVQERTIELSNTNAALQLQIQEHENARREIVAYQKQLRKLAAELSLSEARDRRSIASDLHDHIGQALAFIRLKISGFSGESVFCGFEESTSEILTLLDQTIQYTRSLTFQISPPVLYELGLGPALDWLAEQFTKKHRMEVKTIVQGEVPRLAEEIEVFAFRSVQEILTNAVKHAQANKITVKLSLGEGTLELSVSDNGVGFPAIRSNSNSTDGGFGLFSIRERLMHLGGSITIDSSPNQGACVTLLIPAISGKIQR